jgi:hypothetical protein
LVGTGFYTDHCLLHVDAVTVNAKRSLITAGTDGYLAVWPFGLDTLLREEQPADVILTWTKRYKAHQSSIKCMCIKAISHSEALIVTGGDDNAIVLTRVGASPSTEDLVCTSLLIPKAHASAINGIEAVELPLTDHRKNFQIFTVSNDQRLKTWLLSVDTSKPGTDAFEIMKQSEEHSDIADASCISLHRWKSTISKQDGAAEEIEHQSVIVAGVGMDSWTLSA